MEVVTTLHPRRVSASSVPIVDCIPPEGTASMMTDQHAQPCTRRGRAVRRRSARLFYRAWACSDLGRTPLGHVRDSRFLG